MKPCQLRAASEEQGQGGAAQGQRVAPTPPNVAVPVGRERVRTLYEMYIGLKSLQKVWHSPLTDSPVLEPCFAAGFHGIELCFLLLSHFISDSRTYVSKQPRVELVAEDIATQCKLLTEVIDGELDDEEEADADCVEAEQGGQKPFQGWLPTAGAQEQHYGTQQGPSRQGSEAQPQQAPQRTQRSQQQQLLHQLAQRTASGRLSLTQPFPFPGCPPTTALPARSPGLQRLLEAVGAKAVGMTKAEHNSLVKLVLNLSSALDSFQRWSVGLGIEPQLNELRAAVGLPPLPRRHSLNLDYAALVQPWVAEQTLAWEQLTHAEDFFFRTTHLGAECWLFLVHNRIATGQGLACEGRWHAAAAHLVQASRMLHYLGSHIMLLTRLNTRDYQVLRVELEGISGEGSAQVRGLRGATRSLFQPLASALLAGTPSTPSVPSTSTLDNMPSMDSEAVAAGTAGSAAAAAGSASKAAAAQEGAKGGQTDWGELQSALLTIYEFPDQYPGLYNYAKALEDLEAGLLGGFYFKHFCLASNVIGSDARGTIQRAVQGLKSSYEAHIFPELDAVRCQLGKKMDQELAARRGRMMRALLEQYTGGTCSMGTCSTTADCSAPRVSACPFAGAAEL